MSKPNIQITYPIQETAGLMIKLVWNADSDVTNQEIYQTVVEALQAKGYPVQEPFIRTE